MQQATTAEAATAEPGAAAAARAAAAADDESATSRLRPQRQLGELTWRQLDEYGVASMADVLAARASREAARAQLRAYLARSDVSGEDKGWARCNYILRHGTLLFQCESAQRTDGSCRASRTRHNTTSSLACCCMQAAAASCCRATASARACGERRHQPRWSSTSIPMSGAEVCEGAAGVRCRLDPLAPQPSAALAADACRLSPAPIRLQHRLPVRGCAGRQRAAAAWPPAA